MVKVSGSLVENWQHIQVADTLESAVMTQFSSTSNLAIFERPEYHDQGFFLSLAESLGRINKLGGCDSVFVTQAGLEMKMDALSLEDRAVAEILLLDFDALNQYASSKDRVYLRLEGKGYGHGVGSWHPNGGTRQTSIYYTGLTDEDALEEDILDRFPENGEACVRPHATGIILQNGDVNVRNKQSFWGRTLRAQWPPLVKDMPASVYRRRYQSGEVGMSMIATYSSTPRLRQGRSTDRLGYEFLGEDVAP